MLPAPTHPSCSWPFWKAEQLWSPEPFEMMWGRRAEVGGGQRLRWRGMKLQPPDQEWSEWRSLLREKEKRWRSSAGSWRHHISFPTSLPSLRAVRWQMCFLFCCWTKIPGVSGSAVLTVPFLNNSEAAVSARFSVPACQLFPRLSKEAFRSRSAEVFFCLFGCSRC